MRRAVSAALLLIVVLAAIGFYIDKTINTDTSITIGAGPLGSTTNDTAQ